MWDVQGDSPCARLDLPPGKNKIILQNMIVDDSASFILVPFNGDETFGLGCLFDRLSVLIEALV